MGKREHKAGPAQRADWRSQRPSRVENIPIGDLAPDPDNPRKHSHSQIRAIAKSIQTFGFNAPILIDKYGKIIAGHGRYEAAKALGLLQVPVIRLEHLTE